MGKKKLDHAANARLAAEHRERLKRQRLAQLRKQQEGKPEPSEVTVTKPDGKVEMKRPYSTARTNRIIAAGEERWREVKSLYGDELRNT